MYRVKAFFQHNLEIHNLNYVKWCLYSHIIVKAGYIFHGETLLLFSALRPEHMTIAIDQVDVVSTGPGVNFGSSPSFWIRYKNGETTVGTDGILDPIMSAPGPAQGITRISMGSWSPAEWLVTTCIPALTTEAPTTEVQATGNILYFYSYVFMSLILTSYFP